MLRKYHIVGKNLGGCSYSGQSRLKIEYDGDREYGSVRELCLQRDWLDTCLSYYSLCSQDLAHSSC